MKCLFLDIDGVCNNKQTQQRFQGCIGINPDLAAIVRRIIEATGCDVVLSSTWRLNALSRAHVEQEVCSFVDVTPMRRSAPRGMEVNAWLSDHPEVTQYAILDDDSDFLPDQPLFQTSFRTGITNDIADAVIAHLNSERA
jgi:hypothetical protein